MKLYLLVMLMLMMIEEEIDHNSVVTKGLIYN